MPKRKRKKRGIKHFVQTGKIDIDPLTKCWIWIGYQDSSGYGRISRPVKKGAKARGNAHGWQSALAHKYMYELYRCEVPKGVELRHLCHRRSCCNPYHVEE